MENRRLKTRIEFCYRCNLRCRMCDFSLPENQNRLRRGGEGRDLDPVIFDRFVDEVLPHARECIIGIRAEPMMSRRFDDYFRRIAGTGVPNTQLHTNGTLLTERKMRMLCDHELSVMIISVDGMFRRTFEHIRPGANFDKLLARQRQLVEIRGDRSLPVIQWNFVMMRQNLRELPGLVDLAAEMGVGVVHAFHMIAHRELAYAHESCYLCPEETNAVMDLARQRARIHGITLHLPMPLPVAGKDQGMPGKSNGRSIPSNGNGTASGPPCGCADREVVVTHTGDVHPCVFWYKDPPLGNLGRQPFSEIWEGQGYGRLRAGSPDALPHYSCNHCPVMASLSGKTHEVFFDLP